MEEWYYDNDLYGYLEEQEKEFSLLADNDQIFDLDNDFVQTLTGKNIESPIAVLVFSAFLEKIDSKPSVKLTKVRKHITRNFWKELDQIFDLQLFSTPTLNQEDIGLYHYFYLLGKHLKLYRITGNKLIPTELLQSFLKLSDGEKFVLMMDGLWNQLSWSHIQPSNVGGAN